MCLRRRIGGLFRLLVWGGLPTGLFLAVLPAPGFEADNFCLPLQSEMADMGAFWETAHTIALEETVAEVNARIEKALRITDDSKRTARLAQLHRPEVLVDVLMPKFGYPLFEDTLVEGALGGRWARQANPGQLASHNDVRLYLYSYFPLDPRRLIVLTQSRTVKAYGVYFSTDKIVHFHRLGASYYRMYRKLLARGLSSEASYRRVIACYAGRTVVSEKILFGSVLTGVYSNADLAANHAGFKFLMNLTEKVVLKGQEQEPLINRCGVFWQLSPQVRHRSGWFSAFVSDHWNEALNPNHYDVTLRPGIRRFLRSHASQITEFYTQKDGRPNEPAYFDNLARELSTYYGEAYGHSEAVTNLLTIGNTCFPALRQTGATSGE